MGRQLLRNNVGVSGWTRSEVTTAVDNVSMGFWFNSPGSNSLIRVYNGNDSNTGMGPQVYPDGTNATLACLHGGIGWFGTHTAGFSYNVWNSCIYVRSSGTAQLYLNGVASGASWTNTPNTPTGTGVFGVASLYSSSTDLAPMKAAEAFMYTRALSASEITAIGANRYSPLFYPLGLVGYSPGFGQDSPEPGGVGGQFGGAAITPYTVNSSVLAANDHPHIIYPAFVKGKFVIGLRPAIFAPGNAR